MRSDWSTYFMSIAVTVGTRSTCVRRQIGAIIVKNRVILSTGYNGAPRGVAHCIDTECIRNKMNIPSGERHEICKAVHAEQNAIIQADPNARAGADMYSTTFPCIICAKMIINAGLRTVYYIGGYGDRYGHEMVLEYFEEAGIELRGMEWKNSQ